uniref:Uncharacterized protein n=1 Tax=Trichogramma kaykai TaxID=54128 RepID=A0ABD2WU81_9HYME
MDFTAVLVQVQSVNGKKGKEEKKDKKEEKNEETDRVPLIQAAPSAIPAADGRRSLPPIPEVDDEREPGSVAGSSQSLGYVAVPIIQPNETEAGAAVAAPGAAVPVATFNNGRSNGGRVVRVKTRTRNNLVTSRQLLIQCLTQDVKVREQEIKNKREREIEKRESPTWIRRVVGFCVLVVLCVLVVGALVKLILYYTPVSG